MSTQTPCESVSNGNKAHVKVTGASKHDSLHSRLAVHVVKEINMVSIAGTSAEAHHLLGATRPTQQSCLYNAKTCESVLAIIRVKSASSLPQRWTCHLPTNSWPTLVQSHGQPLGLAMRV